MRMCRGDRRQWCWRCPRGASCDGRGDSLGLCDNVGLGIPNSWGILPTKDNLVVGGRSHRRRGRCEQPASKCVDLHGDVGDLAASVPACCCDGMGQACIARLESAQTDIVDPSFPNLQECWFVLYVLARSSPTQGVPWHALQKLGRRDELRQISNGRSSDRNRKPPLALAGQWVTGSRVVMGLSGVDSEGSDVSDTAVRATGSKLQAVCLCREIG
ncbi:hypothetical protein QBC47DRAFT_61745 [Echria macrotheca]|uniref:Uncharacterized protein n=1 Tax=Echria macrotheca TaxID=438768 RepID=A0AAJ0B6Y6_9PEZI|nr:hypothetical protein QBC47DRAFT_61745 [Echria macrotheca]